MTKFAFSSRASNHAAFTLSPNHISCPADDRFSLCWFICDFRRTITSRVWLRAKNKVFLSCLANRESVNENDWRTGVFMNFLSRCTTHSSLGDAFGCLGRIRWSAENAYDTSTVRVGFINKTRNRCPANCFRSWRAFYLQATREALWWSETAERSFIPLQLATDRKARGASWRRAKEKNEQKESK